MTASSRSAACPRTAGETPCAASTATRPGRHLVDLLDEDRAAVLEIVAPRGRCARSGAGRTPARRTRLSARSTISMARSTPAQNDRGEASSTSRSPAAAPTAAAPARPRAARAAPRHPATTVPGRSSGAVGVSTIGPYHRERPARGERGRARRTPCRPPATPVAGELGALRAVHDVVARRHRSDVHASPRRRSAAASSGADGHVDTRPVPAHLARHDHVAGATPSARRRRRRRPRAPDGRAGPARDSGRRSARARTRSAATRTRGQRRRAARPLDAQRGARRSARGHVAAPTVPAERGRPGRRCR